MAGAVSARVGRRDRVGRVELSSIPYTPCDSAAFMELASTFLFLILLVLFRLYLVNYSRLQSKE